MVSEVENGPVTARRRERQPPEVRREQILTAAAAVLLERGLNDTTVGDVAQAAGVAKGTIYLYFRSKAELLTELRRRYLDAWLQRFDQQLEQSAAASCLDQLEQFLGVMYDFSHDRHRLHHLLFHEAEVHEQEPLQRAREVLVELIQQGVDCGEVQVADVETAVEFLLHGLHALMVRHMHHCSAREAFVADAAQLSRRVLSARASSTRG